MNDVILSSRRYMDIKDVMTLLCLSKWYYKQNTLWFWQPLYERVPIQIPHPQPTTCQEWIKYYLILSIINNNNAACIIPQDLHSVTFVTCIMKIDFTINMQYMRHHRYMKSTCLGITDILIQKEFDESDCYRITVNDEIKFVVYRCPKQSLEQFLLRLFQLVQVSHYEITLPFF